MAFARSQRIGRDGKLENLVFHGTGIDRLYPRNIGNGLYVTIGFHHYRDISSRSWQVERGRVGYD
jgi:hypothetical protein